MPDVKISALPAATVPLAGTEVLPIVQSATTRQVSVANLTAGRAISASSATVAGRATFTASGFDAIAASTGTIQGQTSYGGVLAGSGSSYDVMICNRSGSEVLGVIANTQNLYAAGTLTGASTISVGAATPSTSGAGITFPATQSASSNANTLDDYEEGTWTPTDGSGAGLSLTVTNATYTKIGRMVYASAQVAYPVTASAAQAVLASLPFAVGTVPGTGLPHIPVTSSALQIQINVKSINNAEINIYPTAAGVTNAQLSGVAFISFTLIYPST